MLKYFIGTKVPIFLPIKREHFNRNTFAANIEQRESCSTQHSWFKELWYSTHIRIKPCTAGVTFSSLTERSDRGWHVIGQAQRCAQMASKSSTQFTCGFTAVSMRRSQFLALLARLPTGLRSPFTANEWFLSSCGLKCEMASKAGEAAPNSGLPYRERC